MDFQAIAKTDDFAAEVIRNLPTSITGLPYWPDIKEVVYETLKRFEELPPVEMPLRHLSD